MASAFWVTLFAKIPLGWTFKLGVCYQWVNGWVSEWQMYVQYCSKVSYHHLLRFAQDKLKFHFSRDASCFSQESLKHLVWHILCVRKGLCETIVALQFIGKSMGPSNRRCMYALINVLIACKIHIKQISTICSDNY